MIDLRIASVHAGGRRTIRTRLLGFGRGSSGWGPPAWGLRRVGRGAAGGGVLLALASRRARSPKPGPTRSRSRPTPFPASPLEASAIILELLRRGYEHRHDAIELLLSGPMRCVLDEVEATAHIEDRRALSGGARCRQVVPPLVAGRVLPRAFFDIEYDRQGGA